MGYDYAVDNGAGDRNGCSAGSIINACSGADNPRDAWRRAGMG